MKRLLRWAKRRWMFVIPGTLVALFLGVQTITYVYIHFFNDPAPKLTFANRDKELAKGSAAATAAVATNSLLDGTWAATSPSTAGYRIKETLNGQSTEAVGRTTTVDGSFFLGGSDITSGEFNVDLTTLKSDSAKRDDAVRKELLLTDEFPVATFVLAEPIALGSMPDANVAVSTKAKGTLSLRGEEKPITLDVQSRRVGDTIEVSASAQISFTDFGIPDPSKPPFVAVESSGTLEVLLTLKR